MSSKPSNSHSESGLFRILRFTGLIVLVTGSLMAFPVALPVVILLWLILAVMIAKGNRSPWKPLLTLLVLLVIRNPEWSPAFLFLIVVLTGATLICFRRRNQASGSFAILLVLFLTIAIFTYDFHVAATTSGQVSPERTAIVCLGDSLTDCGYPQELQKLIREPVMDYGRDGITSEDGVKLLPEILAANPRVLVLELGGHDYNQGRSRASTYDNLSKIIRECQLHETQVLLVAVPRGFIRDPFRGIERQLAREFDLPLIPDSLIRKFVLFSNICPPGTWIAPEERLSNDGLHPNENGNRLFAETVAAALKRLEWVDD